MLDPQVFLRDLWRMTIASLIEDRGIKRVFIARKLGVQSSTVTRWAKGDMQIMPRYLQPLADILGVPVEQLVAAAIAPKEQ